MSNKKINQQTAKKSQKDIDANDIKENDVINNSDVDTLYSHPAPFDEKSRIFQMVVVGGEEKEGFIIKTASRTLFKVIYNKSAEDIKSFELVKLIKKSKNSGYSEKQRVKLSSFNFSHLGEFLKLLNSSDLKAISERKIKLANEHLENFDQNTKEQITTLLQKEDGKKLIEEVINNGLITSKDIVNTGYRKKKLSSFDTLLKEKNKEEKTWQEFFHSNQWIFGYGLDYRFKRVIQKEFASSRTEGDGSSTVFSDFLLGDKKFTTFVEIKTPDTKIFAKKQNRSNSWRLSNALIYSVSQILEQKASGQLKLESGYQHNEDGHKITHKAYDSKTILIIGCWDEIEKCNDKERQIKEKTFELFRRDLRNIEIITYDELYDRAKHIVERGETLMLGK